MTEMPRIAQEIWAKKYKHSADTSVEDMWQRVAGAVASVEQPEDRARRRTEFYSAMEDFKFIPAGRILSAAGTDRPNSTMCNCFVMGAIEDSMEGIFQTVKEAAVTQRQGGGVGYDFSPIRPSGDKVVGCGSDASGPVSFMRVFDSSCGTIVSAGLRRGAQIGVLRCDHPDIERFIDAKRGTGALKNFNLSVAVTDKFMAAVKADADWELVFGGKTHRVLKARELWDRLMRATYDYAEPGVLFIDVINRMNNLSQIEHIQAVNPCLAEGSLVNTPKGDAPVESIQVGDMVCTVDGVRPVTSVEVRERVPVLRVVLANGVVLRATAAHIFHVADGDSFKSDKRLDQLRPGDGLRLHEAAGGGASAAIVSIKPDGEARVYDIYEKETDTWVAEGVVSRGCGEQNLPPYGACLLGSINLSRFVSAPFTKSAAVDMESISNISATAVRMLDNVVDISNWPLPQQGAEAKAKRRIGLGVTGLADMLAMKGLKYDSPKARELAEKVMESIKTAAYRASSALAAEKGPFPLFEHDKYSRGEFFKGLPDAVKADIQAHGMRNSHLLSIAPTGTISLLAGNVSSGLEPVFALKYDRKIRTGKGDETTTEEVRDYAYAMLVDSGADPADAARHFQPADEVSIEGHLQMQACLQKHVDASCSKTVNIPADYPFDKFKDVYKRAYALGLKGCTTFRPSEHIQGILTKTGDRPKEAAGPATKAGLVRLMWAFLAGKPVEREAPRPEVLPGVTYKLRVPGTDDAYYVTINDEVVIDKSGPEGVIKPYEVFINTKNLTHFPWIVSMTRMLSAIFRKEDNPAFIADELLSVYDPVGGFFDKGRYVPSVAAAIGHCIKGHLASIGAAEPEQAPKAPPPAPMPEDNKAFCPQCSAREAVMSEGCLKCLSCGYSKCG